MEATDAADQIREVIEEERAEERGKERFRNRAALVIAVLAMLLAITSLGGGNADDELVNCNIQASDTWAFYQAKNIRQTANKIAADALEADLLLHGDRLTPEARAGIERRIAEYKKTVARYEDEPDEKDPSNLQKGEGKKQLRAQAEEWVKKRERADRQGPNFDYATVLLQIAIVLGSVAILAMSIPILGLAITLGAAATVLMLNGFFLLFPVPL
jgi:uncharacterized protein DUF4337